MRKIFVMSVLLFAAACAEPEKKERTYYIVEATPTSRGVSACSYLSIRGQYAEFNRCMNEFR